MHREPDHDSPEESKPDRDNLRDRGLPFFLVAHLLVLEALYKTTEHSCHRLTCWHGSPIYTLASTLHVQRQGTGNRCASLIVEALAG
jgi:hypothetical protein